jgi:hypothetical protein
MSTPPLHASLGFNKVAENPCTLCSASTRCVVCYVHPSMYASIEYNKVRGDFFWGGGGAEGGEWLRSA